MYTHANTPVPQIGLPMNKKALHYITLRYITLHYVMLRYITLHYITLHYITAIHRQQILNLMRWNNVYCRWRHYYGQWSEIFRAGRRKCRFVYSNILLSEFLYPFCVPHAVNQLLFLQRVLDSRETLGDGMVLYSTEVHALSDFQHLLSGLEETIGGHVSVCLSAFQNVEEISLSTVFDVEVQ